MPHRDRCEGRSASHTGMRSITGSARFGHSANCRPATGPGISRRRPRASCAPSWRTCSRRWVRGGAPWITDKSRCETPGGQWSQIGAPQQMRFEDSARQILPPKWIISSKECQTYKPTRSGWPTTGKSRSDAELQTETTLSRPQRAPGERDAHSDVGRGALDPHWSIRASSIFGDDHHQGDQREVDWIEGVEDPPTARQRNLDVPSSPDQEQGDRCGEVAVDGSE